MAMSQEEARGNLSRVDEAIKNYLGLQQQDISNQMSILGKEAEGYLQLYDRGFQSERAKKEEEERKFVQQMEQDRFNAQLGLQQQELAWNKQQAQTQQALAKQDMTFGIIDDARKTIEAMLFESGSMSPQDPLWNTTVNKYLANYLQQNQSVFNTMDVDRNAINKFISSLSPAKTSNVSASQPGLTAISSGNKIPDWVLKGLR
jgi:hypothetical protein